MYSQRSKWATSSIVSTVLVIAVLVGIGLWLYTRDESNPASYVCWTIVTAWSLFAMLFCPIETRVGSGVLQVIFCARVRTISLQEVASVRPFRVPARFLQSFGSCGFFGWWGWYRTPELGKLMVYAANLDNLVCIELRNGRRYVLSCTDPIALTEAILRAKG